MSLRDLVDGDCGGANPLVKLRTQYTREKGPQLHQQTRADIRRSQAHDADALVHEFLSSKSKQPVHPEQAAFRMDRLLSNAAVRTQNAFVPTASSRSLHVDSWVHDFAIKEKEDAMTPEHWKYLDDQWTLTKMESRSQQPPVAKALSSTDLHLKHGSRWAEEYLSEELPVIRPINKETNELQAVANQILESTRDEPLFAESQFFTFLSDVGSGDSRLIDGNFVNSKTVKELKNIDTDVTASRDWAEEFSDLTDKDVQEMTASTAQAETAIKQDFWQSLEDEWQKLSLSKENSWLSDFEEWQPSSRYEFQEVNPLRDHPDALEEGKRRLAEGDIPSAVLLFEAAVQDHSDQAEAWSLLGMTQAKNENDPAAIAALTKAVELNPHHLGTLMALAVSYTNESYQAQACRTLQDWIQEHPQYRHLHPKEDPSVQNRTSSFMSQQMHRNTIEMFLAAARMNTESAIDPDIQCGLGILFNLSNDYEKAADCFKAALQVRPEDVLLWNRLGATLANGNQSEEAVSAYRNALQKLPGFIRCRYNLGISCVNLKAYSEAAQHFLTALNFQAAGRGPQGTISRSVMSDSIWASLRFCISLMGRTDLHQYLETRDLSALSKEFNLKDI